MSWSKGYEDSKKAITVGPWGDNRGTKWDDGLFTTVRQLIIFHGSCINAMLIEYDKDGRSEWSKMHGSGVAVSKVDIVRLDYPHEFLTNISGSFEPSIVIKTMTSLTLYSNQRMYGPYGGFTNEYFICGGPSAKIVGFHGNSGGSLFSIGVHIQLDNFMNHSGGTRDAKGDSNDMDYEHQSIMPAPTLTPENLNFQRCIEVLQGMKGLGGEEIAAAINFLSDEKMAIAFLTLKGPMRMMWLLSSIKK